MDSKEDFINLLSLGFNQKIDFRYNVLLHPANWTMANFYLDSSPNAFHFL